MDPIADMLTRIRNALMTGKRTVEVPASNLKREILKILVREGFIRKFVILDDGKQGLIKILLKYRESIPVIQGIVRVSKPGCRHYVGVSNSTKVLGGLGVAILSTSSGVLTDREARERRVGGEMLCKVW